ncbi:inorganic triphosphatase [Motiliproteus sp. MSK22-1]|uniref:CYTH domain-containing protein n=1 Tax=Motiliproteus sp. MSK22-1 TaxID=1897630 RepID=UPI0009785FD5|nr:CYTH domain-containing protein [Motiliproteus sp. MSK22-1]OMH28004.1 hypothetical protein BGP75_21765 [Motiliproteus sp. MSK22-1]
MAQEIELKLSLPASAYNSLREQPLLKKYQRQERETRSLCNLYFDTPELALNRHKIALRIRRQGDRFIQTLKTRGSSQGGLHQRQEWEWDLESAELDCSLLPADALPQGVDLASFEPVFSTDFERTVWKLRVPGEDQDTDIELVLDEGWAIAGAWNSNKPEPGKRKSGPSTSASITKGRDAISEVELELLSGDPGQLYRLALELSKEVPLRITRVSKAERGFRLLCPERARQLPQLSELDRAKLTEHQLLMHLLTFTQSAIESFEFLEDPQLLSQVLAGFEDLQALSTALSLSIPQATQQALASCCQSLRHRLGPWLLEQRYALNISPNAGYPVRMQEIEKILRSQSLAQCLLQLSFAGYSAEPVGR